MKRNYIWQPIVNGTFVNYLFTSDHKVGTSQNKLDAMYQVREVLGDLPKIDNYANEIFLDTPKNRREQLVNDYEIIDCRVK